MRNSKSTDTWDIQRISPMMESAGVHSFIYFLKRHYVFNANCILLENKGIIILERKRNRCYWTYTIFGLDMEQTFDNQNL